MPFMLDAISSRTLAATSGVTRRATQAKLCPLSSRAAICSSVVCVVFGVGVHDGGQSVRGGLLVVDLGGHGVDGVHLHGHGQFVQIAVVEHAAPGSYLKGALLLLLRRAPRTPCGGRSAARTGGRQWPGPEQKEEADQPEARLA